MRLFVALEVPENVREAIASLAGEFRPLDNKWKWTRAESLHITLKFIGETQPEKLEEIVAALQTVGSDSSINMKFQGLGFFPNKNQPRVLWVGVETSANLPSLAAEIDAALASLNFPRDERTFTPHLTLARCKEGRISSKLREAIERNTAHEFGALRAASFDLIESKLKSTGAEYTTLHSFPFVRDRSTA